MQTIIVTGGSGLVGKALQSLRNDKYQWVFLSSKDGNLEDFTQADEIFVKYRPNIVIHLAANVGGLFKNLESNFEMFVSNMKMNMNIIQLCNKYKVSKLISCLSTCVFPDGIELPMKESDLHQGPPHNSNRGYAYAKRMIQVMTDCLSHTNTTYINIIPTNIYGPHDNFNIHESHVIPGIIHKLFIVKQNNKTLTLRGTGTPLRQFIYSDDLAIIIINLLNYDKNLDLIISPDRDDEISIKDLALMIGKIMKCDNIAFEDNSEFDGQMRKTASNKKLRHIFPNFVFTPIGEGLRKTIDWFISNYDSLRK